MWYRTTNLWTLKNMGDNFISKAHLRREIVIGAFHRQKQEQNVKGSFVVVQFIGDTLLPHDLYCTSFNKNGNKLISHALIQRIHQGKRGANDVCSWAGHIAECEVITDDVDTIGLSTVSSPESSEILTIPIEKPHVEEKKHKLVVCVAPMYIYTDWKIMVTGIETWLALGATKIIVPIQSIANISMNILQQYERDGIVTTRPWPKWPVLSDTNPNGLVLSRGIEESHVNCLHFVKPFAELVAFTDIDDMLIPPDPSKIQGGDNLVLLQNLFSEHPQAGSLLFEHRDVQFVLPPEKQTETLSKFTFDFLHNTQWKQNCFIWRMKTRVVVNASRVDTVNMHETGIHRMGYVQVRVPCRKGHFYHLRHSYKNTATGQWKVDMTNLSDMLNKQWQNRLTGPLEPLANEVLAKSATESFEDLDKCVMKVTDEHFTLKVSRCMTPHVCFTRRATNSSCVATDANYGFARSGSDFIINTLDTQLVSSTMNCDAPLPRFTSGSHFYLP
ncbi:unnamed protein product [Bursaphelenchus okinawaensis]|uniref:Glycosyltransferase family 92 protein n=1 Tax=Bursaphelenchus okinawaensis TaxID=465554 RepID=A0A811KIQ2_9BILA|nr:unnamed protein product [Bursaphelenchus okinawaensis]CAG9103487.1 unnamed protein product [Bursaphelenchus okinawaensis]